MSVINTFFKKEKIIDIKSKNIDKRSGINSSGNMWMLGTPDFHYYFREKYKDEYAY